jgi:hypothetical protein
MKYYVFVVLAFVVQFSYAQKQGIKGKVIWESGNQMPGPDQVDAEPIGIKREVYIYEATAVQQTTQHDGIFFSDITSKFIRKVTSKKNGKFCVKLPPGEYSLFVKEPQGLFANSFDGQNRIQVIRVQPGEFVTPTFLVNYTAAY